MDKTVDQMNRKKMAAPKKDGLQKDYKTENNYKSTGYNLVCKGVELVKRANKRF